MQATLFTSELLQPGRQAQLEKHRSRSVSPGEAFPKPSLRISAIGSDWKSGHGAAGLRWVWRFRGNQSDLFISPD